MRMVQTNHKSRAMLGVLVTWARAFSTRPDIDADQLSNLGHKWQSPRDIEALLMDLNRIKELLSVMVEERMHKECAIQHGQLLSSLEKMGQFLKAAHLATDTFYEMARTIEQQCDEELCAQ